MGCIKRITGKPISIDLMDSLNGSPRATASSYSGVDFCSSPFVFSIDTTLGDGTNTFIVPMDASNRPMIIYWGDGSQTSFPAGWSTAAELTHTYASSGTYDIELDGQPQEFCRAPLDGTHIPKINDIKSWGNQFRNDSNLIGCINLTTLTDKSGPIDSLYTSFFDGCTNLNDDLPFAAVTTTAYKSFAYCFSGCVSFNGDLSTWSPNGVAPFSLNNMFLGCDIFNNDSICGWDVSGANTFVEMFSGASQFNQDLTGWDVSSAGSLVRMFKNTSMNPANISGWVFKDNALTEQLFADTWPLGTTVSESFIQDVISCVSSLDVPGQGLNVDCSNWWLSGGNAFAKVSFLEGEYPAFDTAVSNLIGKGWTQPPAYAADGVKLEIDTNLGSISPPVINGQYPIIDWGDGTWERASAGGQNTNYSHTYSSNGTYIVTSADITYLNTGPLRPNNTPFLELTKVLNASALANRNFPYYFKDCPNLIYHDPTWLDGNPSRTDCSQYMQNCTSFNGDVSGWNTVNIDDWSSCFRDCTAFTGIGIGSWTFKNNAQIANILLNTAVETSPPLMANILIDWNANPNQGTGVSWNFIVFPMTFSLSATVAADGYDGAAAKAAYDNLIATTGSGKSWTGSNFFTWDP